MAISASDLVDAGVFANEGDVMQLHQFTSVTKAESAHRNDGRNRQTFKLVSDGERLCQHPPPENRISTNEVAKHVRAGTEMVSLGQRTKRPSVGIECRLYGVSERLDGLVGEKIRRRRANVAIAT